MVKHILVANFQRGQPLTMTFTIAVNLEIQCLIDLGKGTMKIKTLAFNSWSIRQQEYQPFQRLLTHRLLTVGNSRHWKDDTNVLSAEAFKCTEPGLVYQCQYPPPDRHSQ